MELHEVIVQHVEGIKREGDSVLREFDAVDSKGRRLGAAAHKFTGVRVHKPRMLYVCTPQEQLDPAGPVWGFSPSSRRNGEHFGASQSCRWFETAEQRDEAIAKYLAQAEKAAAKKAA